MIYKKLQRLIAEQCGLDDPDEVDCELDFEDDLGFSDFNMVELSVAVESEFDIELTDEQIASIKNVGDLLDAIEENLI
ncbi:MAG: acyl carrier protein [Clostridia bacterium]|nr:acyl carrier protein [Clostridia bacterium]